MDTDTPTNKDSMPVPSPFNGSVARVEQFIQGTGIYRQVPITVALGDPEKSSMELGETGNRFKVYYDATEPLEVTMARIDNVRKLQEYALKTGTAPAPKPSKA